ncbi:flavin-dependent oxidoreductase [Brevundimonas vesicularis]|uniref:flavin-dependent oxidoreductase n=1 Tax=Brevundimonas vesicularis TaxID=41276 RepID=UPI0038D38A9F
MEIAIVGGGIVGLALALGLHKRGLSCRVYEAAPEVKEVGVGITLLPHAMRELTALGLGEKARALGIELTTSAFYNRFGQKIYDEKRGLAAGYPYPEVSIHRGRLHNLLYQEAVATLGDRIVTDHKLSSFEQDDDGVTLHFVSSATGDERAPVRADIVIGCDGVNSAVRKALYPDDKVVFTGINTWRGVTRRKPILDGKTYLRVGSIRTGKIVIYPIVNDLDEDGCQLINWVAEIERPTAEMNDWNQGGQISDFLPVYEDWTYDWLDVAELIRNSETLLEYPMVDKDPLEQWTFGRVTLAGDAAHPMYPRGSNGSAQGLIDARTLADKLAEDLSPAALKAYEAERLAPTGNVVRTNRSSPPDIINIRVEELTGDKPFDDLDLLISQDELRQLSDQYKRVAGFAAADIAKA